MKYYKLFIFSLIIFFIFSVSTISVIVNSQESRPREDRGTPQCTKQIESSGRITTFLDCASYGRIYDSQICTPSHPRLQKEQLIEVLPSDRRNCTFIGRNECLNDRTAAYSWTCNDDEEPISETKTVSIVCPVSCTKHCPNPPNGESRPCNNATWNSTYCKWNTGNCGNVGGGGTTECDPLCEIFTLNGDGKSDGNTSNAVDLCCLVSPIVVDIDGDGFRLTSASDGVMFDFNGDGVPHRTSWTKANSDEAWLVLDRNENGTIDNGSELFGNFSPQPQVEQKHGFLALAEYDKIENGGNEDGKINNLDLIFSELRLWQDKNHNGISESRELKRLRKLDVKAFMLDYRTSNGTDRHGNEFRYKAKVRDTRDGNVGKWAWDVFLVLDEESNYSSQNEDTKFDLKDNPIHR